MASIDLGGGSVQEAYALSDEEAAAAPDKMYLTELHGGGKTYHVYVHRCVRQLGGNAAAMVLPLLLPNAHIVCQPALLPTQGEAPCPAAKNHSHSLGMFGKIKIRCLSSCAATWATA